MDPVTISLIASAGLGIAQTIFGARDQARQKRLNDRAATIALTDNLFGIELRRDQENRAAALESLNIMRAAAVTEGSLTAVAGASGVGRISTDILRSTASIKKVEALGTVEAQRMNAMDALDYQERLAYSQFDNRRSAVAGVNPWAVGLQIAGVGLDTFTTLKARTPRPPTGRG